MSNHGMSNRSTELSLRRRPSRVVPASITAAVLLLIGAAAVAAVAGRLVNGRTDRTTQTVLTWLSGLRWNSAAVLTAAIVAIIAGIVLIVVAVRPGRRDALQLDLDEVDAVVPRRVLARLLRARVEAVDGVQQADAAVDEHRIVIQVATATRYTDDVRQQVSATVDRTLAAAGLQRTPRHRVVVRQL